MRLQEKVALVTGAGSGIGRAVAVLFAEEGARVVVNDVNGAGAEATVARLPGGGGRALVGDVADSGQVRAMFTQVEREFGTLDILVNNAGIGWEDAEREALAGKSEARLGEMLSGQGIQT